MSVLAVLVLAQAGHAPSPAPPALTPQSVTTPIFDVECAMEDVQGWRFEINFRQTGGRGFTRSAIRPGAQGVGWTEIETVVLKDTSGRYLGEKLITPSAAQRGWPGIKQTRPVAGNPFQTQFLSVDTVNPDKILLQIQPKYPLGVVSAFGLCTVRKQDQSGLKDNEAKEQISL